MRSYANQNTPAHLSVKKQVRTIKFGTRLPKIYTGAVEGFCKQPILERKKTSQKERQYIEPPYPSIENLRLYEWGAGPHAERNTPRKRKPIEAWTTEHESHGKAQDERVCIYCGEPIGAYEWYIRRVYSVIVFVFSKITFRKVQKSVLEVEYEHIRCPREDLNNEMHQS